MGAQPEHLRRPQATTAFANGNTLVPYTDGLVERRREDSDTSLARLTAALIRHREAEPGMFADALLLDLFPAGGATDDTALIGIRL